MPTTPTRSGPRTRSCSIVRDAAKRTLTAGGLGSVGEKAASALADFVILDMFATVCTDRASDQGRDRESPSARRGASTAEARGTGRQAMKLSWTELRMNRNLLGFWFMLPAAAFLVAVPGLPARPGHLALRSPTPHRHARASSSAWRTTSGSSATSKFQTAVFFTLLLHRSSPASSSSRIGLYLALLLNENMPFKAIIRAIVLIPFIVPTVLSAIAFWWIYDPQFSIISWIADAARAGSTATSTSSAIAWNARWIGDLRQRLARRAVRRDLAAGRPADRAALALRGGDARRRHALADVPPRSPTRC